MKCARRELDGNFQLVTSGGLFFFLKQNPQPRLSKQRTIGEIKSTVIKTKAEQHPLLQFDYHAMEEIRAAQFLFLC